MTGTLGTVQPFRYRGYVYDEETGLFYLRSRYYHASLCRFISNDSLIKGNLYTYCGNKPVCNEDANGFAFIRCREANGDDTNFMPSIMCGGDGYLIAGIARLPRKKSIQQRVADKGVTFNPSNDEYGGEIVNSYKLNPLEMIVYTEFLKDEYGDIYEGTAVGFYFEWAVHDFAYAFFSLVGNEKKVEQSKSVDFGATIYDDKHDAFSLFMFTAYQVLFPFHSLIDRYVHITQ